MTRIKWSPGEGDITVDIPELGVSIELVGSELVAMARKAHDNKRGRSQSGPARAFRMGNRPEQFNDRFTVYKQHLSAHSDRVLEGASHRLTKAAAEQQFAREVASGENTYVELRGPKSGAAGVLLGSCCVVAGHRLVRAGRARDPDSRSASPERVDTWHVACY